MRVKVCFACSYSLSPTSVLPPSSGRATWPEMKSISPARMQFDHNPGPASATLGTFTRVLGMGASSLFRKLDERRIRQFSIGLETVVEAFRLQRFRCSEKNASTNWLGPTRNGPLREQHHRGSRVRKIVIRGIDLDLLPRFQEVRTARKARVDRSIPPLRVRELRQLDPLLLEVSVEDEEEPVHTQIRAIFARVELHAHRARVRVLPRGRSQIRRIPRQIRHAVGIEILAEEELPALKDGKAARQRDGFPEELDEITIALD